MTLRRPSRRGRVQSALKACVRHTYTARLMRAVPLKLSLALLVIYGGCQCRDESLEDLRPTIEVVPNPIELGLRRVGADTTRAIRINNRGTADLEIRALSIDPAAAPYRIDL